MKPVAPKILRCAIYTRVSTDHGLEQEFNSLDNQREAAQAYVKSQAHEGWRPVRERYDDGGFSGGSLERPALQRLLADIARRAIDVVVVYKVDRLTRSLADFAKLVELFDQHGVSFVSVTQSFNTTSSMGRLTLNVLLSFAQFEREVTGERIRDKIAASKRKGIWVGGPVPFGYALQDRKLIIDESEAATVRMIYQRYLVLGSLPALQRELRAAGIVTRQRVLSGGGVRGGGPLTNGPLQHLLRNRVYRGELNHRGESYPAEHAAIIDADLFAAVQARLDANRQVGQRGRLRSGALLIGLLRDDRGHAMSPSYADKNGIRYRYYVSTMLPQGRRSEAGTVPRVAAEAIEAAVIEAVLPMLQTEGDRAPESALGRDQLDRDELLGLVERITLRAEAIDITFVDAAAHDGASLAPMTIPFSPKPTQRRREVIEVASNPNAQPMRAEARAKLLAAIARARSWLREITGGTTPEAIAARESMSERAVRMILSLAFIAPDIVQAAVDGTLPRGFGLSRLTDLPMSWAEQRKQLGLDGLMARELAHQGRY